MESVRSFVDRMQPKYVTTSKTFVLTAAELTVAAVFRDSDKMSLSYSKIGTDIVV